MLNNQKKYNNYWFVPCPPSFFWYHTMCFHTATDWARVMLSGNSSRKCLTSGRPFLSRNTSSVSTSLEQHSVGVWTVYLTPIMQLVYAMLFSMSWYHNMATPPGTLCTYRLHFLKTNSSYFQACTPTSSDVSSQPRISGYLNSISVHTIQLIG